MMSMTKSLTAVLVAKYVAEGLIDLNKTVADYIPELAKSGWGPDSLRAVWDMRDGAAYSEVYDDPSSTVWQHSCASGWLEQRTAPTAQCDRPMSFCQRCSATNILSVSFIINLRAPTCWHGC